MVFGWDDAAMLALAAYSQYNANKKGAPTAPPPPPSYYNADGSFQSWNPQSQSYFSMGARTPADELQTNWGSRLLMNKMLGIGGYDTTRSNLASEIKALQDQYAQSADPRAQAQITGRIRDLMETQNNLKDTNVGYSPIGVTDPTQMLRYRGATDTVHDYLMSNLDEGYKSATDSAAVANAHRGMGQSTMADWGQNEMARKYATDKEGVAVQSEDYFRQLQAQDEAAKMQILGAAQGGLGLDASLAAGRNSASQSQMGLAQQLASYNNQLQYNWTNQKDAWSNQQNQNIFSTLAGVGKMAAGGYTGGTAGMLGMPATSWGMGWGGTNYNPNRGGSGTSSDSGGGISWPGGQWH